ncbi:MAG: hypothetical protein KGL53_11380, partial [Elusimicrobia bacterium]|nr:hypothetical protein [Elusimicrobiota bacterium]
PAADGGGGGGSGGGILLSAATISGGGELHADGGSGKGAAASEYGGGGGGGRIAANAAVSCSLSPSTVTVDAGSSGDSGTGVPGVAGANGSIYSSDLSAPTGFLGAVLSSTSILWDWSGGAGAASLQVLASTGGARSGALAPATVDFQSDALLPNTTYGAFVRARGCGAVLDSGVAVSTTLARPVSVLANTVLGIFESSMTVAWAALPAEPVAAASVSAEGFLLEASTAADFSGTLHSSSTPNVALSTLSLTGLAADTTYYLRVGTLNLAAVPDFASLGSTRTPNFLIGVVISTHDLDLGNVDLNSEVIVSTSFIVTSLADLVTETYEFSATTTTAGSPWKISTSSGTDTFTLQAVLNAAQPLSADFGDEDKMLDSPQACTATVFAAGQNCVNVPPGADRLLWFKLGMPQVTTTESTQDVAITVTATSP